MKGLRSLCEYSIILFKLKSEYELRMQAWIQRQKDLGTNNAVKIINFTLGITLVFDSYFDFSCCLTLHFGFMSLVCNIDVVLIYQYYQKCLILHCFYYLIYLY